MATVMLVGCAAPAVTTPMVVVSAPNNIATLQPVVDDGDIVARGPCEPSREGAVIGRKAPSIGGELVSGTPPSGGPSKPGKNLELSFGGCD
jgi:hypothetical protein